MCAMILTPQYLKVAKIIPESHWMNQLLELKMSYTEKDRGPSMKNQSMLKE